MSDIVIPAGMEELTQAYRFAPARCSGNLLFVSGQIGTRGAVLAEGIDGQIAAAFENIATVLAEAGCDFSSIVEITSFHVGDVPDHLGAFVAALKQHLGDHLPAWTAVGTTGLGMPGALVEVKVVAEIT